MKEDRQGRRTDFCALFEHDDADLFSLFLCHFHELDGGRESCGSASDDADVALVLDSFDIGQLDLLVEGFLVGVRASRGGRECCCCTVWQGGSCCPRSTSASSEWRRSAESGCRSERSCELARSGSAAG